MFYKNNNIMKKIFIVSVILFVFSNSMFAQFEIKANLFGLIFKNYGAGIEYGINNNFSANIFVNQNNYYSMDMMDYAGVIDHKKTTSSTFSITPEIKFFFIPDKGIDNMFISVYFGYQNSNIYDMVHYLYTIKYKEVSFGLNKQSLIIGFGFGKKKVFNSGIFIDVYYGIGKMIPYNITYSDYRVEEFIELNNSFVSNIDLRMHLSIGYRFGKKK